jgi:hypothetical protein
MDKHALRPTVVQSPMIVKLRNQYWYTKLGGCGNSGVVCHKCGHCGGMKPQGKRTVSVPVITAAQPSQAVESREAVRKGETALSDSFLLLTMSHLQRSRRNGSESAARWQLTHMHRLQVVFIFRPRGTSIYHQFSSSSEIVCSFGVVPVAIVQGSNPQNLPMARPVYPILRLPPPGAQRTGPPQTWQPEPLSPLIPSSGTTSILYHSTLPPF